MLLTNEEYVERLNQCLKNKLLLLEEIYDFTRQQTNLIDVENFDMLAPVIDLKQESIDKIDKIDKEFHVYFNRLKVSLKVKSLEEINSQELKGAIELQENVREVFSILNKIGETEKENMEKTNKALNQLKDNINKVKVSKKANSAYLGNKSIETESYFIDSKK